MFKCLRLTEAERQMCVAKGQFYVTQKDLKGRIIEIHGPGFICLDEVLSVTTIFLNCLIAVLFTTGHDQK